MADPPRSRDTPSNKDSKDAGEDLSLTDYMSGNIPKETDDSEPPAATGGQPQHNEWSVSEYTEDEIEPNVSPVASAIGRIGVFLAIGAVILAVGGILFAFVNIQPIGNAAMAISLGMIMIAMFFGVIFQISKSTSSGTDD